jgi:enoyl-CoA hydratase/carnithine racemase
MSIKVATIKSVTTIEIARPEKKNALTVEMYQAMADALNAARQDAAVRAVLITGQPGIFTSGNDLEDFMARAPSSDNPMDSPVFRFMAALKDCEKPVVAAVTGAAIGIGTTMLLHCDLVYVSDEARLAMPFVSLGLVPEYAASHIIPRLMGHAKAAEKRRGGQPCPPHGRAFQCAAAGCRG